MGSPAVVGAVGLADGQGGVVDDEGGLEGGVLGAGEQQGHRLAGEAADVERLLAVAGSMVQVGVGGQGGPAQLHGELVVLDGRGGFGGVDVQVERQRVG